MAKEPKTKEQFLDKMLMSDFSGDIRDLAADRNIVMKRVSANVLDLHFTGSDRHFQLVVRKPRSPEYLEEQRRKREAKAAGAPAPRQRTQRNKPAQQQQQH